MGSQVRYSQIQKNLLDTSRFFDMLGLLNYQHVPLPKCCETEDQRSELPESTPLQKRGTLTKTKDMEIQDLCVDICTLPETNIAPFNVFFRC